MRHIRRDTFKIDKSERVGERLKVDGRMSRIGIQIYRDSTGEARREYRPPEEVFSHDSLESLKGIPITIQHPSTGMVTRDNYRRLNVGHVGDDPRQDSDGKHVLATLWILDGKTIDRVERGDLTELSVGYWASLEAQSGTTPEGEKYDAVQRDIKGNHLALLKAGQARGGPTLRMVLDADENAVLEDEEEEDDEKKKKTDPEKKKKDEEMKEKEKDEGKEKMDALQKERDELKAKLDAVTAERDELKAKLDSATDPEEITRLATERANLINDARKLAPEFEFKGSDIDIKKAALEQAGIKLSLDSADYVTARFEAALESHSKADNESLKSVRKSVKVDSSPNQTATDHPGIHLDRG